MPGIHCPARRDATHGIQSRDIGRVDRALVTLMIAVKKRLLTATNKMPTYDDIYVSIA